MNLLQVHRPRTVDLYMAYCDELRAWKERFRLESVADTETALWTYHELVAGEAHAGEISTSHAEFYADIWIQRRRVAQVAAIRRTCVLLFTQPWMTVPDPLASATPAVARPAVSATAAPIMPSRLIVKLPPTAPPELSIPRMTRPRH